MEAQRIQAKLFFRAGKRPPAREVIALFHRFIQTHALPELLIDVTDYSHVKDGPGVVLIAHESNYSTDGEGGRVGILCSRKRDLAGPFSERLGAVVRATVTICRLIEAAEIGGAFDASELVVRINDRLLAPNNSSTFSSVQADFTALAQRLFRGAGTDVTQVANDPRELFTVRLRCPSVTDLAALAIES